MIDTDLKRTALFTEHCRLNARLVDFGGWEMPLHYGSQIEEHQRVRRDAGVFDVSHMLVIDVEGVAAREFLRRVLANDVARLTAPGKALYSCLLNEAGGILDDLIVYHLGPERYRLVVNAATAEKDLVWITGLRERFAFHSDLRARRDLAMIAVQGPEARRRFWQARETARVATEGLSVFQGTDIADMFVARTGYTGEDGLEIMVPAEDVVSLWRDLLAVGVAPCGLGARDTLRLEAGMNLYGQDMDESVTPMESGLAWTVDLTGEREFIGRQALLNAAPRERLVGLLLLDRGVLRSHQPVRTAQGEGVTTSGSFSPTLNSSIAFARVPQGVSIGDAVQVRVRDKWLAAKVVTYPFVRMGKSLL
ncbi:MAG TPA: glycine cleavage system aminomethyltransferase GcvT [Burkholderiales bacterium]|nr:glycine cleavage system aminomethyltransferase GcvT [Burkholderiales bacterium]